MSRQRKPSRQVQVDEQIQVVLAVLMGKLSLAEAVIDYANKYCLATTVTPTSRGQDASPACGVRWSRPNGSSTSMISAPTEAG